ncbi:MAG TPA: DUF4142 domain-containing protein [Elusimicrobiota bacterium]|nr:DUF4142 domain-containing protein [Elusimicrobiota bacterium]
MNSSTKWIGMIVIAGMAMPAWCAEDTATKVLSDLHHTNQMEIQMGMMAEQKGQSPDVKSFGSKLVKDHQDADNEVVSLAKKDDITLETPAQEGMIAKHEARSADKGMAELSSKTGADFDKAFAKTMVDDHKKDIAKLEKAQRDLHRADVRDLVAKLLPTLREHLSIAQRIEKNG